MEGKRAVFNWQMLLAVLVATVILGHTYWKYKVGMGTNDVLYLITLPMALSMFTPYAGVFPAIPYSLSFMEEYNSGYIRFAVIRSSRARYVVKKILAVALSGGVMMAAAFVIIFLYALILGTPTTQENVSEYYAYTIWNPLVSIAGGKLVLFLKLILAFLFGLVWSNISLFLSAIFLNRYVAFVGTFILYQVLWQGLPVSKWNPVYLLRADVGGYASFWEPVIMQLICLCIICGLNGLIMGRRLQSD